MTDSLDSIDLDAARDEMITTALTLCPQPVDAVSVLFTAGFAILMEAIGPQHAVGSMRQIVNAVAGRMVN